MSDHDKMMAFGHWLTSQRLQRVTELGQMAVDAKCPSQRLRIKAGHIEAFTHVLDAFKELYEGDLKTFMVERLGQQPEEEEESKTDGAS